MPQVNVNYGTTEDSVKREGAKKGITAVKITVSIIGGLMAAAMVAAISASMQVR